MNVRLLSAGFLAAILPACASSPDMTRAPAIDVLESTAWQLVRFEGGDGTVLTPDDGSKYTIAFGSDGRVSVRVDCNRGTGTWTSVGPNHLVFGPLALTRAMCPPESMHDRVVRDWEYVRSYVIEDGHLFLSLMADSGIYEYEPTGGDSSRR
jgi:para-nitrobenzyl esterase